LRVAFLLTIERVLDRCEGEPDGPLPGGANMADRGQRVGRQPGNYRLMRLLEQGNFSEVY